MSNRVSPDHRSGGRNNRTHVTLAGLARAVGVVVGTVVAAYVSTSSLAVTAIAAAAGLVFALLALLLVRYIA